MKKLLKNYSVFTLLLAVLALDKSFGQSHPWFENPAMFVRWTNFTALPTISSPYNNGWAFAERQKNGGWELAAIYAGQRTNSVMMISESTTTPVFHRVGTNYPTFYANWDVGFTTIVAVQWTNQYRDFFLGSGLGLFRYNEATELLDPIWSFSWDPIIIADLGGEIAGLVFSFGSQSGLHTFSPVTGHQFATMQGGMWGLWADPVSKTFDDYYPTRNLFVRSVSDSQSIIFREQDYSTNGGLSYAPIGVRSDGVEIWIRNAYVYEAPDVVILLARDFASDTLQIGKLGGTFYSLNFTGPIYFGGLFYSRNSRLLIAGNADDLYAAVLPDVGQMAPILSIQNAVIVSWSTQYSAATLEGATNVGGPWQEVTNQRVVVGDKVQVAVPADLPARFFRLLLP